LAVLRDEDEQRARPPFSPLSVGITTVINRCAATEAGRQRMHAPTRPARKAVVVATGSDTARPPIPGMVEVRHCESREATSAKEVPERLVVIGRHLSPRRAILSHVERGVAQPAGGLPGNLTLR